MYLEHSADLHFGWFFNLATGEYEGGEKFFEEDTLFAEGGEWGGDFGRRGVSPLSLVSACQGIHKSANTPEYNLNKYKTQSSRMPGPIQKKEQKCL